MNKPRVIRWVACLSGLFLLAWLAPLLILPMVVDSAAVKAKARAFIAEKINVSASIEKIEIFWFPRPGFMIQNAVISVDKEIHGVVRQLRLYPSLRQALSGNLAFSSITADGAQWTVRMPARSEEPFNFDQLDEKIRFAVKSLASAFPGMKLRIRGGGADIGITGGASLIIKEIDATFDVNLGKVAFAVSGGANFADSIRLTGEIAPSSLATEARLSGGILACARCSMFFLRVRWDGLMTVRSRLTLN